MNHTLYNLIKQALDDAQDTQINIKSDAAREILARAIVKKINDSQ